MAKIGAQITVPDAARSAFTDDQSTAYQLLTLAREARDEQAQRKARRMLRKAGIYLSKVDGHGGSVTLTAEKGRVPTDTPKAASSRANPVKGQKKGERE